MRYMGGPISEEEFYLREKCYGQVKVEYARQWIKEHGYTGIYGDLPIRDKVECDKYLDVIMGTDEARERIRELEAKWEKQP